MKIEVLGTGCPKCEKLKKNVEAAVQSTGVDAEVVKVSDLQEIMKYGVMSTPALVINGEVKFTGKVSSVDELITILKEG